MIPNQNQIALSESKIRLFVLIVVLSKMIETLGLCERLNIHFQPFIFKYSTKIFFLN